MRIAIDARELTGHATGVGRYLRELLTEWAGTFARRHDLRLYLHRPLDTPLPAGLPAPHLVPGAGGSRWEQWAFARAVAHDGADVLFAPGYTAPLATSVPVALAVHDVSFFAHPEWFSWREGARRRVLTAWSAQRAAVVLAPSAFSAREIVRYTRVEPARVRLTPLGVRPPATPPSGGGRRPLVLFVGSLFQRRRLDALIDGFARVAAARPRATLEIVGANRTVPPIDFVSELAARGLADRARVRDWVDDATLERLYADASVFVFLSRYEGFGFTPLEAMSRGAVPVVLDTPVAREIYGDAAWYLPERGDLATRVAGAVGALLDDEALRRRYAAAAAAVLARYTWADTARQVGRCLEEAAGG